MRLYVVRLMALTMCLLIAGPGCNKVISAPQGESEAMVIATNDSGSEGPGSESATGEEESPPSAPPEPGPSALESPNTPEPMTLSSATQGVVDLLRAGVGEDVLMKYVSTSAETFDVGSTEIIFLTDLGASGQVINAMIEHDQQLRTGEITASPEPWPPAGTVVEVPATETTAHAGDTGPGAIEESVTMHASADEISVDYFYHYLAPYGTWIDVPGYGLCWQPTVAVTCPGWMPYGDRGRWVYTDYGWYWYSDYSWGWAAFHYGRWLHHTRWGWCWVPGTVWGPSWVTWRYSYPYCGWAPLPPYCRSGFYFSVGISWGIPSWCYTYIPSYRICTYYPRRCAVPYKEARHIHRNSRIRDHYSVGRNHTIENRGIPPEDLTDNSTRDIRRAQVRERDEFPAGTIRRERLEADGKTLSVYMPRPGSKRISRVQGTPRSEPRTGTRQPGSSLGSDRTRIDRLSETSTRSSSRAQSESPSHIQKSSQSRVRRDSDDSVRTRIPSARPPQGDKVTKASADRIPSSPKARSEPSVRQRPAETPSSSVSRFANQPAPRIRTTDNTRRKPNNALIISGRGETLQKAPASPPSRARASSRSTTTVRSTPVPDRQGLTRQSTRPSISSEARPTTSSVRTWSTAPSVRPPGRTPLAVQPRSVQSPRVDRSTPSVPGKPRIKANTVPGSAPRSVPATPRYRVQPSHRAAVSTPPQGVAPVQGRARTFSRPPSSVRSGPTVRQTPSVNRAPQRAPSYTPAPPTRSAAPTMQQGNPRSVSPGKASHRPGGRSR